MKNWLLILLSVFGLSNLSHADNAFDHDVWDKLVTAHVHLIEGGKASQVDYQAFADNRAVLKGYLSQLEAVDQASFDAWPKDDQLAFLINAYNAWTVELILTNWPDLESIKNLGSLFSSPWSKSFIPLLGKERSLDDIEHKLIRGTDRYQDPRIHFAVNCASIGCPALANQAYQGDNLDHLLEAQTQLFLGDSSRNRLVGDTLEISSIFKWYKEDFEKGWKGYQSLESFLAHYGEYLSLSEGDIAQLTAKKMDIDFLKYDWGLNAK
ncbi:DUF547 domain-containing protein [Marinomonas epiphytica]